MILGQLLDLSVPWFYHMQDEDNTGTYKYYHSD